MVSNNLRLKVFSAISVIFFLLAISMIFLEVKHHKNILIKKIDNTNKQLSMIYTNSIESLEKSYSYRLKGILSDTELVEAFYNKDRKKLYKISSQKYRLLKKENIYLSVMHFHTVDNKSFLRLHRKHKYGDDLSKIRDIVVATNRYKKSFSGFEVGKYGLFFRVTTPVFYQGKHIGSIELGIKAKKIMSNIHKYMPNYDSVLVLKNSELTGLSTKSNYLSVNGYSKAIGCDEEFFDNLLAKIDFTKNYTEVKKDFKNYIIHSNINIEDFNKESIGKILVATDINDDIAQYQHNILKIIFGAIFTYVLVMLVVNYAYKYLLAELQELNRSLESRVKEEIQKYKSQEKLMIHQSKLATMGEMLSMIAHQWRQPLTAVFTTIQSIELKYKLGKLDGEFLKKQVDTSKQIVNQMSQTIDDFRNFFKPTKELEDTLLSDVLEKSLTVIKPTLSKNSIEVVVEQDSKIEIKTYSNELMQVVLNILTNANDALKEIEIKEPIIEIKSYIKDEKIFIDISDNAGGINDEIIDQIFEPYFSTKSKNGTGLGLYMSKIIIEDHLKGKLFVKNGTKGAIFTISLDKKI
jgi:signal transduction histidine kinase